MGLFEAIAENQNRSSEESNQNVEDKNLEQVEVNEAETEEINEEVQNDTSEDSSLNNESKEVQEVTLDEAEEPEPTNEFNDIEFINETFGTQFESLEEAKQELLNKEELRYADEQVAVIDRFVRETGRSVNDYFKTQTTDYKQMADVDILREAILLETPGLSSEEVESFILEEYRQDEDEYSDREIQAGSVKMKRDAERFRKTFSKVQEDFRKPIEKQQNTEEQNEGLSEEDIAQFKESAIESAKRIKKLEFEDGYIFNVDERYSKELESKAGNIDNFLDTFVDEKGNFNFDEFNNLIAIKDNISEIVKNGMKYGASKEREKMIAESKNPNFNPQNKGFKESGKGSVSDVLGAMLGGKKGLSI